MAVMVKAEIRLTKLERSRLRLKKAEEDFVAAIWFAYPVGTLIRYTTSGYDVLYRVLEYAPYSSRMKVKRAYQQNGTVRWLDGASMCVDFYQEGAENR
jgi:hypothetical protein